MKTKIQLLEEKKEKLEKKIKKYQRESKIQAFRDKTLARKERAYKLIKLGALFEICSLLEEDHRSLLGYLSEYKNLSKEQKENFFNIGAAILEERKKNHSKKTKKNTNNKSVDIEQIKNLIKLAKEKNVDVVKEMQAKFKKKLLEHLTIAEYEDLKKYILEQE